MSLVQIPIAVRAAAAGFCTGDTVEAATDLSALYRAKPGRAVVLGSAGQQAYLAARLPATYAAAVRVFERYCEADGPAPTTLLDVACGPGTASLAAAAFWPDLQSLTRSDLDATWRPVAETLGRASGHTALAQGRWLTGALPHLALPVHDLAVAAYALNEMPSEQQSAAVAALWPASAQALILVEPGTPQGFLSIRQARAVLIGLGAHIVAPCTHQGACPMSEADWCHTSVRLARDAEHRRAKNAALTYEDEKFAYVVALRAPVLRRSIARIVKRPQAHKGHVRLDLCTDEGLARLTISRRDRALYRPARNALWGDVWPPVQEP